MSYVIEGFKSALQNIKSNKMRSFLTMLGIIIGISSVITIVSLGQGGKNYITGQFESIGTNVINVSVSNNADNDVTDSDYFTMEDVNAIKSRIEKVTAAAPVIENGGKVKTENKSKYVQIDALTQDYTKLQKLDVYYGRFLNERDVEIGANVAVIDDIMAEKLFRTKNAVGQKISVNVADNNSLSLKVIGVMKNPAGELAANFGDNVPGFVFVPITIADRLYPEGKIAYISVMLSDMNNSSEISSKIVRLLEVRHNNTGKYRAEEGFKQLDTINDVLNKLTLIIGAIAGISLLVGGIGVMNIMLVSVTERTREIGIRKALGATMADIRIQFLTESLILCLVGGIIGMSLGVGVGNVVGKFLNIKAAISVGVILIAFLFSSAVGIFFGLYPANKAAKLDPIEALRYE